MRISCLAREVVHAALAAVFLALALSTKLAAGQATVQYSKFLTFFELLDQSGELAQEYAAADGDLCQVKGIDCENGQVVVINFANRGLVGELIKDTYVYENLPWLRNLNLRGNQLGYGVAPIPNDLAKLLNVEYLDLSNNAFTGEMPTFTISSTSDALRKVTHIDLSNNQLRGRLRWNWAQLPRTTGYINLSGNQLSGALPQAWYEEGGMAGIDTLDVSRNSQDICGDGGGQMQAADAFAARGVTFMCKADGSDSFGAPFVPGIAEPQPLFDEYGEPITDAEGDQIFLGPDGEPLVDAGGNSIVDADGGPLTDVHGNPVARNPDGSIKTDATGNPIFTDSEGDELVAPDGTSLHGPNGHFTQDVNGNPAATGPDGSPVTDPDGLPVFVGPDGTPLVTPDGSSQSGTDGQPVSDSSGNPVLTDADGEPVLDPDGSPVFVSPTGPLVDTTGTSIVGPDGDLTSDVSGNPVATSPGGAPITDPSGAPVFVNPDGTPLVDEGGTSIIGPNGNITADSEGNPVTKNPDGSVKTDTSGNPIFIGDDGNPIVDETGMSTRGWDGAPLTDGSGQEIPPAVFTPNGTVIPGGSLGGEPVYDADGNPIFDSNGNPVVLPEGGKAPPSNGTVGGAPWIHGDNTTLPNGDPAGGLATPVCASPLPFEDPLATCADAGSVPVCLSPDQLVLNATSLSQNDTMPPNLLGCDGNVTQTFFHQFFPGETAEGAFATEKDTLTRMQSVLSGNKPVSVVSWTPVFGSSQSPPSTPQPPAASPGSPSPTALGTAELVDEVPQRRLLTRMGGSVVPLAGPPERYSLTGVPAPQRALRQVEGQDSIGVMGYFLVTGGTLEDLQALVSEFSGVGQEIAEDGTPFLTQRQTSELPECGEQSNRGTVLLSTLAVCLGILLAGLVIAFYTITRLRKKPRQGHGDTGDRLDGGSNTTFTPSGTVHGALSEYDMAAMSPNATSQHAGGSSSPPGAGERPVGFGSVSGKMPTYASFGSVMGATSRLEDESDSPRSGSRENEGASQASLGRSALTLQDGMGGRKPSGHLRSGSWPSGRGLEPGSFQAPQSQDSDDGGQAAPLAAPDTLPNRSDSSSNSTGSNGDGTAAASYAFSAAAAGAAGAAAAGVGTGSGNSNGGSSRASAEHELVSMNGPLPPIAEHVTHSEMNSETTSSMGGGGSTAGISPQPQPRPTSGSSLNPHFRPPVVAEMVEAESSLLEPTSASLASQQADSSALITPTPTPVAEASAGAGPPGGTAAAAAAATAAAATAVAMSSLASAETAGDDEKEVFHTLPPSSLDESVHREGATLTEEAPEEGPLPAIEEQLSTEKDSSSAHATGSSDPSAAGASRGAPIAAVMTTSDAATTSTGSNPRPPTATYGAAAYPQLAPTATGPGGAAQGCSGALESVTGLGSMGIANLSEQGSTSQHGAAPTSQGSSIDERGTASQHQSLGHSLGPDAGPPISSSMMMFDSNRAHGPLGRMRPDEHVATQPGGSMLGSHNSTIDDKLQAYAVHTDTHPRGEEEYDDGESGDVEVTHVTHEPHAPMPDAGGNPSEIGVNGSSMAHLVAVQFNPLLENSASMGLGGDVSQMQSIGNPRSDAPGPSGVLRQAYDLCDSMGQVADHTVVPSDHLDTGVMISVPQQPTNGSPGSSAQNLEFVAARYTPDSHGPGPQLPAPTGGDSGENPVPAGVPSIMSSEEATGRLEVPTSLEEMMMASQNDESQFRSFGSHALYASHGNSAPHSNHSTANFRSTQ